MFKRILTKKNLAPLAINTFLFFKIDTECSPENRCLTSMPNPMSENDIRPAVSFAQEANASHKYSHKNLYLAYKYELAEKIDSGFDFNLIMSYLSEEERRDFFSLAKRKLAEVTGQDTCERYNQHRKFDLNCALKYLTDTEKKELQGLMGKRFFEIEKLAGYEHRSLAAFDMLYPGEGEGSYSP
ncbi:MAG: hypothetical protein K0U37_09505 [Gammaproteobacteria bacterium]|nr:hypothetical protein [Gammaproteobacteria bacterium]